MSRLLLLSLLLASLGGCSLTRTHPAERSQPAADPDVVERDLSRPYERAQ